MEYTTIKTEVIERVGVITLDYPPLNSVSKRMMVEIMDALTEFENDHGQEQSGRFFLRG